MSASDDILGAIKAGANTTAKIADFTGYRKNRISSELYKLTQRGLLQRGPLADPTGRVGKRGNLWLVPPTPQATPPDTAPSETPPEAA